MKEERDHRETGMDNAAQKSATLPSGIPFSALMLREYRVARLENQTDFWARFGVTQSRGSRFELGMELPPPVIILLSLYMHGVITDDDLDRARREQGL
jgi:hypothetical protein